jgi:hypothetical protein
MLRGPRKVGSKRSQRDEVNPGRPLSAIGVRPVKNPGRCRRSTELSTRGGDSRADEQTTADTLQPAPGGFSVDRLRCTRFE